MKQGLISNIIMDNVDNMDSKHPHGDFKHHHNSVMKIFRLMDNMMTNMTKKKNIV